MLITRPRRFGKTLGMNMLASFHYSVESNREYGEGRSDIVVYDEENSRVVIFEAKVAKSPEELPAACDAALRQIEARQYAEDFRDEYDEILCYGKRCGFSKRYFLVLVACRHLTCTKTECRKMFLSLIAPLTTIRLNRGKRSNRLPYIFAQGQER